VTLSVLLFVLPFFLAGKVVAQPQTNVALAETLYQQARDLMSEGRYDEACPKLEESYRLDPATGTLLNLASCHEKQGKLATAWFEYSDGITMARRDARPDRVSFAQGRLAELEPKLSKLTIVVPPAADVAGLELELDGARIGPAARGVPTPVDPGTHVVEARAPGRKTFREQVEIGALAEQKTVTLPALEATTSPVVPVVQPKPVEPKPVAPPPEPAERPIPTSAIVAGAVTAGLVVGAVATGFVYLDKKDAYEKSGARKDYDGARTLGIVNAALWAGSAAGAGITAYFYVTRPEEKPEGSHSSRRALPVGVGLSGKF
jgi:tetratricopeptide (TPR) repeat protein